MQANDKYQFNSSTLATMPLISVRDLHKSFGENHVLKGLSFEVHHNQNLAIVGKSGSGKSVLLKCIIGLIGYEKGKIYVLDREISQLEQPELDQLRTQVGFLFQGSALYDSMTVRENLQFPMRRHPERVQGHDEESLIMETLESVGLPHTADMMPEELSGGMKRRIALARALILKPSIILYDEPTSGLDPITSREIIQLIMDVKNKYQTSALIISHDMECVKRSSDRMIILYNGVNYAEGPYFELLKSNDSVIKSFLG